MSLKCKKCNKEVTCFKLLSKKDSKKVYFCPNCKEFFSKTVDDDEETLYVVDFENKIIEEVK